MKVNFCTVCPQSIYKKRDSECLKLSSCQDRTAKLAEIAVEFEKSAISFHTKARLELFETFSV